MNHNPDTISLRSAAIIAGIGLLIMTAAAPVAELLCYPKLVIPDDASGTVSNILAHKSLYHLLLFGYLIAFICDIIVAWALYILFKPVNNSVSQLAAWFRLVYTMIALVALLSLVDILQLLQPSKYLEALGSENINARIMILLRTFRKEWYFGLLFFGIHLGLLGYLVIKSKYVPWIIGVLLIIAGAGYFATTIRPYLFPGVSLDLAKYTFYGELIFMLWLLIRGWKIKKK